MSDPTHTTVTDTTVTPARILRDAAAYLAEHGWRQGDYYGPARPKPSACAAGAIAMVVYGCPIETPSVAWLDGAGSYRAALDLLARSLGLPVTSDPVSDDDQADVYSWNDAHQRSADDVIAAMHAGADGWETRHLRCPGCAEPVYSRPPTDWQMPAWYRVPAYSHREGDPLCPDIDQDGYRPAEPVTVGGGAR